MKITGAEIVMECLLEQGVDTVFGYPGGNVLHLYDALYRYRGKIRHILTAHEQGAAHAADGYARSTGHCGVCIATSGPGATNLVTGIATAYMDSVPVVFLTGNVPMSLIGKDAFQEADITGITIPITKHNTIVSKVDELADTIREAFAIAVSGRPGPVLVDIPKDVAAAQAEFSPQSKRIWKGTPAPQQGEIDALVRRIQKCRRPFIFAGGGVIRSGACAELRELSERMDAPVACSLMGLGAFPGNHPLYTGMLGMHGAVASNRAVTECDLLIGIGCRFSDRVFSNPQAFGNDKTVFVHIDIDRAEINKNILVQQSLLGDAKEILQRILEKLPQISHPAWIEKVSKHQCAAAGRLVGDGELEPRRVLEALYQQTGGRALITTDVGQHQIWTAQYYPFTEPNMLLTSGGFGTMGYGLGAAIGAQLGNPHRRVIHISGDGSFRMNCNELATVQAYGLPIITILLDNRTLGMVRQWQSLFFEKRYSETNLDRGPDFCKLAQAYGVRAYPVSSQGDFEKAVKAALEKEEAALIHCRINPEEAVLPMVAPGKTLMEQITDTRELGGK